MGLQIGAAATGRPMVASGMRWFLRTRFLHSVVSLILASFAAPYHSLAAEQADILLHRQAPGRTFGLTSDTSYLDDSGNPTGALHADGFTLAAPASVCRMKAWGFYGSSLAQTPEPAPPNETIRVRVYEDLDSLPGAIVYESIVSNPSRMATGFSVATGSGPPEFLYDVPLQGCFLAQAQTTYWIEFAQLGLLESRFRWENSNTAGGYAIQFPIGTPWHVNNNGQMAYELWTPEPCSGALLALGCGCILRQTTWNQTSTNKRVEA